MIRHDIFSPFGLSLSKPCPFLLSLRQEGQPFDKLREAGVYNDR